MQQIHCNCSRLLRGFFVLGRISNLPTIWSNCLASWLLSGCGFSGPSEIEKFIWLISCASFLYLGGMFLNDAFDIQFDREHRIDRPIPSGTISVKAVWLWGVFFMIAGVASVVLVNVPVAICVLCLSGSIIWYNWIHKKISWSPLIMGLCRLFLYLLAGLIAIESINMMVGLGSVILWGYIVGLSNIAKKESTGGDINSWPSWFLFFPLIFVIIALILFQEKFKVSIELIIAMLLYFSWLIRSLKFTFNSKKPDYGRTVSGLLAGIVLFDLVLASLISPQFYLAFLLLFVFSLLFQRYIPAT
ncbi:MAG: hypothetical protein CMO77_06710 [Verrucomicrobiales bacterium]|nr:hypothetical protein [Verrucomicrobiales bacterium]